MLKSDKDGEANRCRLCVIPRAAHNVEFDDHGACRICGDTQTAGPPEVSDAHQGNDLSDLIKRVKGKGEERPYDCLVGLSGGQDSTYLLYLLVKRHRLRCLAAYYRTPFTPDTIDSNVRRATETLGVPLVKVDLPKEYHRKVAQDLVTRWQKRPIPLLVNLACAPCKMLNREVLRIAKKNNIAFVIFGGNPYESFQSAPATVNVKSSQRHSFKAMLIEALVNAKKGTKLLLEHPVLFKYLHLGCQSALMYRNVHTCYLRIRYPGISCIDYFHYGQWKEEELREILSELGWELPRDCNTHWKADCVFTELKNLMFLKSSGVTPMEAYLSNMVRNGVLPREKALERMEVEGKISRERLKKVCGILDLPEEDLPLLD